MHSTWVIDRLQRALVAMRRINEILDVEPEIRDHNTQIVGHPIRGEIEFFLDTPTADRPFTRH